MTAMPPRDDKDQLVYPVSRTVGVRRTRFGEDTRSTRSVATETPVALVFDGGTQAVMMATPADLEDFALGFALSERIIADPTEITRFEIAEQEQGVEVRLWLTPDQSRSLAARRRTMAGPAGCGLCGIDSLSEALPALSEVTAQETFTPDQVHRAMEALSAAQHLNAETRATHAAGFWTQDSGLIASAEDVGRHNALDKLIGRLTRQPVAPATGMVVMTSRISVELVQKTARLGAGVLAAVSAPTSLAIDMATASGMTLIGVTRDDGFEIFTHPERIGQDHE